VFELICRRWGNVLMHGLRIHELQGHGCRMPLDKDEEIVKAHQTEPALPSHSSRGT